MKLTAVLLCSALALSLTACGGGGGGGADAPVATPNTTPTEQLSEFDGRWTLEGIKNLCVAQFPFTEAPSHYRLRDMTLSSSTNQITAAVSFEVFSDAACTRKLGAATETFVWHPRAGQVAGRDNVIKAVPEWTAFKLSADGGAGLTLNGIPKRNNNITGWEGELKLIADVQDKKLYVHAAESGVAVNAEGFPREFDPEQFFVKN